jgi:hypothetical protein
LLGDTCKQEALMLQDRGRSTINLVSRGAMEQRVISHCAVLRRAENSCCQLLATAEAICYRANNLHDHTFCERFLFYDYYYTKLLIYSKSKIVMGCLYAKAVAGRSASITDTPSVQPGRHERKCNVHKDRSISGDMKHLVKYKHVPINSTQFWLR